MEMRKSVRWSTNQARTALSCDTSPPPSSRSSAIRTKRPRHRALMEAATTSTPTEGRMSARSREPSVQDVVIASPPCLVCYAHCSLDMKRTQMASPIRCTRAGLNRSIKANPGMVRPTADGVTQASGRCVEVHHRAQKRDACLVLCVICLDIEPPPTFTEEDLPGPAFLQEIKAIVAVIVKDAVAPNIDLSGVEDRYELRGVHGPSFPDTDGPGLPDTDQPPDLRVSLPEPQVFGDTQLG